MVNDDIERQRFHDLQAVDLAMARLMADGFIDHDVFSAVFDTVHAAANGWRFVSRDGESKHVD